MTKREEVIKGLKCKVDKSCVGCPYDDDFNCVGCDLMIRDAIKLLEAMAPVPPEVDIDTWVCGNCGTSLERQTMIGASVLITEHFEYCPHCGQEVEWEGTANGTPQT